MSLVSICIYIFLENQSSYPEKEITCSPPPYQKKIPATRFDRVSSEL